MSRKSYEIEWTTTETVRHRAVVSAKTMASMLGVDGADVLACTDLNDLRDLGSRGLENGLSDIEDGSTEVDCDGLERDVIEIAWKEPDQS